MKKVVLPLICFFGLLAVCQTARPVSILISATDSAGSPIRDLAPDSISVMDNNGAARVAVRPVAEAPLSLGIVLLASKHNFAKEQAAAIDLVNKLIRTPNDHAFVITAGGEKTWKQATLDWQSDRDALIKSINALDKETGIPDAFNFDLSVYTGDTANSTATWGYETQQGKATNIFDVALAMMAADKRPARRVLVMFRNPWAHAPGLSERNRNYVDQEHAHIITLAQQLRVSIYTVGLDEKAETSPGGMTDIQNNYGMNALGDISRERDRQISLEKDRLYSGGRSNVERLATDTGGRAWWKDDHNFRDSISGITNDLVGQYMLTFVPASAEPGLHHLKITSSRGAHVLAQEGITFGEVNVTEGK